MRILLLLVCLYSAKATAQSNGAHQYLRNGNSDYEAQDYPAAEESYRKGLEKEPNSLKSSYNLGNTIYHQKRYDEAIKHYDNALQTAKTSSEKAQIYHNMGNSYLQQGKFKESIAAYKNAIKQNPMGKSSQYNLNIALKKLQKQQEQQRQQQQQNNNQNSSQNNQQQQSANGQSSKPQENTQNQPQNQPKTDSEKAKDEARNLLRIMDNEERKVQDKLHKYKGARAKQGGKDW